MVRLLLLLFALLLSNACAVAEVSSRWSWTQCVSDPDEYALFDRESGGRQRGNYNCKTVGKDGRCGVFRYLYGGSFAEASAPPCDLTQEMIDKTNRYQRERAPIDAVKTTDGEKVPTGVQWDKIDPISPDEHYRVTGGKKVNRETALQKIKNINGPLPDYGSRLHLTPVGSKEFRDRVRKDFEASQLKERTVFHDVDPSDPRESWILDCGFKKDGEQLYLQDATGGVIARLETYEGPEALRKIDPNYKPDKDPDPTKPKPILPGLPSELPPWTPGPLAALITFLLTPAVRKEPS